MHGESSPVAKESLTHHPRFSRPFLRYTALYVLFVLGFSCVVDVHVYIYFFFNIFFIL